MTVAAVMVVKDEAENLPRFFASGRGFFDKVIALDTGSQDSTRQVLLDHGAIVYEAPWDGFASARTQVARLARGEADWLLQIDADMTVSPHSGLKAWLDSPPGEHRDGEVTAWNVLIRDGRLEWRMPYLLRGDLEWSYRGVTHSFLVGQGKRRPLLGLTIRHHGTYSREKLERDIRVLQPGVDEGDPRSVYYMAWALKAVGRTQEAIDMYRRRSHMAGWDEERWHAAYMAGLLAEAPEELVRAWELRPHRPEPLEHAARIVRERGPGDDMLFLESR